jgi:hypothetical protein
MLTRRQLYELYDEGPDAMIDFVASLVEELAEQEQRLGWRQHHPFEGQTEVIRKLQSQLKRVKDKLARKECQVAVLTGRVQELQSEPARQAAQGVEVMPTDVRRDSPTP